jgi:hypothetical protein
VDAAANRGRRVRVFLKDTRTEDKLHRVASY